MRLSRTPVFVAGATMGLFALAPGASASARYGPPGDQFTISFPSAPKSSVNDPKITSGMPEGGRSYAYWVSSTSNLFGPSAPVPPTPSYIVIEGVLRKASQA